MKKIIIVMISLFLLCINPATASVKCLSNTYHLDQDFDTKEWYPVACDCPCTKIKNGYCVECGHLQNAATYVVVLPTQVVQQNKVQVPERPMDVMRKLAREYLVKKVWRR